MRYGIKGKTHPRSLLRRKHPAMLSTISITTIWTLGTQMAGDITQMRKKTMQALPSTTKCTHPFCPHAHREMGPVTL
eukprot:1153531-Pelagomonas_calceolata.AAC.2